MGIEKVDVEVIDASRKKKKEKKKKRPASDLNLPKSTEVTYELQVDENLNELTMEEKLASINITNDDKISKNAEEEESSPATKLPSADSVHVLVKQALHADDRVLLLDCLYTQDEKVIANSVSLLNPSDVLKLLDSLIAIIQTRGAVLACALPWLKSLLLQHASSIVSQESSLHALNSLYQLIVSRVSTFRPALQLSSCLDYLFTEISDDVDDEMIKITPIIYEDYDDSDEEESENDAMETDQGIEEQHEEVVNGFSDYDESDEMSN